MKALGIRSYDHWRTSSPVENEKEFRTECCGEELTDWHGLPICFGCRMPHVRSYGEWYQATIEEIRQFIDGEMDRRVS